MSFALRDRLPDQCLENLWLWPFLLQTRGGEVVTATETLVNHFSRGFAVAVVVVVIIIITIYQFCGALAVKMSAREKPLTNCYGIASF